MKDMVCAFKNYRLEIVMFLSGFAVMAFEIVGARVLAPSFGSSIIVWTTLIGVILASLSVGYWYGGRLADWQQSFATLSLIILLAGLWIGLLSLFSGAIVAWFQLLTDNIFVAAVAAAVFLFAPPSILLGMVSPYAMKLRVQNLSTSGQTIGVLSACSSVGSIVGTFLAGFVLLALIGNKMVLLVIGSVCFIAALCVDMRHYRFVKVVSFIGLLVLFFLHLVLTRAMERRGIVDRDSHYNRIRIVDATERATHRSVRQLLTDGFTIQSMMYRDNPTELAIEYSKYYRLLEYLRPRPQSVLLIGGAAYSYPKEFLQKFPHATMDVVEIDPVMTRLAREYFFLPENPRLRSIHEDGRTYINRTQERYDVVLIDAFQSLSAIPFHLATREAVQKFFDVLPPQSGGVIMNVIGRKRGAGSAVLESITATFADIFPHVALFVVNDPHDAERIQNYILVATKGPTAPSWKSDDLQWQTYFSHRTALPTPSVPLLTDDKAPLDYYLISMLANPSAVAD